MPYSRLPVPVNGYTDSLPYRGAVEGYTQECMNVFPYDSFDGRRRIGTRPGFIQIGDADAKIQGCAAVEAFVNKGAGGVILKRRFVYCVGGAFFATDLSGNPVACKQVTRKTHSDGTVMNPFNANYDRTSTTTANLPLNALGNATVDAEASGTERDGDVNVADVVMSTTANVEMVAFKHVGTPDHQAVATTSGGATAGGTSLGTLSAPSETPHDFVYATDGDKYVKINMALDPPEVSQWIGPYSTVKATAQGQTKRAKLLQVFNSRLVLAGIDSNPTNWFFSGIGDGFDWIPNVSSATATVGALAGTSGTNFGEIGDNIKALIPVGSSGLIFACANSMSIMTNDPVFSDATMRQISRSIGCLGPRSFTKIGEMAVLIASTQGVFAVDPNSFDVEKGARITRDKLDRLFANTDFEDTQVVMGYDESRAIVFLCVTRTDDASASRLYAMDADTGTWWPWRIETPGIRSVNNILSFQTMTGTRATPWFTTNTGHILTLPEQTVLSKDGGILDGTTFGTSGDGITTHNPTASESDISSTVQMGPINSDPSRRVLLKEVRTILGAQVERDSSGNIRTPDTTNGPFLEVVSGQTAQEAVGTAAGFTMTNENAAVLDAQTASAFEGSTTIDGGDKDDNPTSGNEKYLWGGFANSIAGTYTPATGDTVLNETTFSGPGSWTFSRNSDGKWILKHGTDFFGISSSNLNWYITTNAVAGLPEEIDINTLLFGRQSDDQGRLATSNFAERLVSEKRALARGRDSANRFRIRASDLFVSISALGRSFAIEDISVDVEDGGPFRSVT